MIRVRKGDKTESEKKRERKGVKKKKLWYSQIWAGSGNGKKGKKIEREREREREKEGGKKNPSYMRTEYLKEH